MADRKAELNDRRLRGNTFAPTICVSKGGEVIASNFNIEICKMP